MWLVGAGWAQGSPPVIVAHPSNRVASVGGTTTFSVTATGTPPLFYRWLKDGAALAFPTNRFLTLTNLQPSHAGIYQATVSNGFGAVTSQPAMLVLTSPPPTIAVQPQDALLCPNGSNVFLSVSASGSDPLRYQWRRNDAAVPNATNSFLILAGLAANIGDYTVVVTNVVGAVTSRVARVQPGVVLLQQPASRTVIAGSLVVFQVAARTCSPPHYQWRFNGDNLPGQTTNALYLPPAYPGLNGNYDVIVSDFFNSVTSAVATLQVLPFPPAILTQPQDLLGFDDTNVLFTVGYDGYPTPSLQWRFNGLALLGETNDFLSFRPTVTSEGGYSVVLSNVYGSVTSRVATLTLLKYPPNILPWGQPQSQELCPPPGNYLSVLVTSPVTFPPVFQWRLNGMDLPGANASWLTLVGRPEEAGDYVVVVSNGFGAVTSQVAHVSLGPVITLEPNSQVLPEGSTLYLPSHASACGSVNYQWQKNGRNIEGAQQDYFYIPAVTEADEGDYTVIAANFFGAVTSSVAVVEVVQVPPEVDPNLPEDLEILAGGTATFFVSPSGAPPAAYQWRFNGVPIPDATNNILSFIADRPQQQGRYSVVLSNASGSVTSRWARLKLLFSPPEFLTEADDIEVPAGNTASFFAYADGAPPPTYQWLFNGHPIPGETNDSLLFLVEGTNQLGGYSVVASNLLGAITSRVATLTVLVYPPTFVQEPADQTVTAGNNVYLYGAAAAAPPPAYQWLLNGSPIPGATYPTLSFQAGFSNQSGGYSLVASNAFGVATSRVAMVGIILVPPQFSQHPISQTLVEGEWLNLYFVTSNSAPAFTQWQVNSVDISGATNQTLLVRTVTTNHTGDYRAIIWNDAGRATSFVAHVEVRSLGALDRWIWRRSLPQGNTLNALAAGHGRIVAVGERGSVAFSTNGLDWRDGHRDGRARDREAIVFGNGVFVALGDGWPEVSSNGVDWVDASFTEGFYASSVAFGNGRFVAVGNYDAVSVSTNGIDWELHDVPELERRNGEVNFANDQFFVSLYEMPITGVDTGVLVSTDGITWAFHESPQSPLGSGLREIAYGHAGFIGLHEYVATVVALSSNGTDWVERQIPELQPMFPTSVAYGNGRYVLSGLGYLGGLTLATSTNGTDWTPLPGIGTNSIWKVFHDGTRFTAVGQYGFIAVSDNGSDWTIVNPGSERNFRAISYENGLFLAVGNDGAIFTSSDGRQWSPRNSGTTNNLRAVTWFNGRFFIVGESKPDGTATILSSADTVAWQSHTAQGNLFGVAHNGERLVAVGDVGTIVTSIDGLSWDNLPSAPNPAGVGSPTNRDLNDVIWSEDRFVAVGKDGVVIHSTDGLHWISSGPGGGRNLHGIAHGNGVFVTVGNNSRFYISTDLTQWFRGDWIPREDISDIIFGGGRFMAVGDNGLVFTSEDGNNWLRRVTVCDNDLRSVVYVDGSYYTAGNNDTILQSGQADAALRITRLNVPSGVQLEILGEAGRAYRLQGSVDLVGWTDLLSFIASTEAARYVDGLQGASDWRFYRVISP
jgi:hypothetical protein